MAAQMADCLAERMALTRVGLRVGLTAVKKAAKRAGLMDVNWVH